MGSTRDNHPMSVHFNSRDVSAAVAFYTDVLGFELNNVWPTEGEPQWASVHLNGQTVMVGSMMEIPEGTPGREFFQGIYDDHAKAPGGGVLLYVQVDDVDGYHDEIIDNGGEPACEPKDEFYGLRNFFIADPDGYRLAFYQPITMTSCQSCGMPLTDAVEGQMYCQYCTDDEGQLKPYEQVLEGTITGFFMGMQKMERAQAEVAAREHLAKMPAWAGKCG